MSRERSHILTANSLISNYTGQTPFASYLKLYFSQHKKYGANDRRNIANLCYFYFRTGHWLSDKPFEEKLAAGIFLCSNVSNQYLAFLQPTWNDWVGKKMNEKLEIIRPQYEKIFPLHRELSPAIDQTLFITSFFIQPRIFVRIRPGYATAVLEKLKRSSLVYEYLKPDCLAFEQNPKLEELFSINKEIVIQDLASQQVADLIAETRLPIGSSIWDCCAASGGKSILAADVLKGFSLTVSDIRPTIVSNLHKRFAAAGIENYKALVIDLSRNFKELKHCMEGSFDLVICDVPCSGSGTWSRTPEQLQSFMEEDLEKYQHLQKQIVSNVVRYTKPGGYLLYVTCSVFKKENEDVVEFILKMPFLLLKQSYMQGYNQKADTMFGALLKVKQVSV